MSLVSQHGRVKGIFLATILIALMAMGVVYAMHLNNDIVAKFNSRRWDIPARVYSSPLILKEKTNLKPADLEYWLNDLLNYTKSNSKNLDTSGTYHHQKKNNTYIINTRGFDYGNKDKDEPQTISITFNNERIVKLNSQNGKNFARLEPHQIGSIYPEKSEDRIIVAKEQTPQILIDALIATEDRGFYDHHGVSIRGTTRAILNNFKGGSMQGGSTLTQQLIKNFYLTSERSLKRKVNEAIMAILLEMNYDKDAILQTYLNEIHLGQNGNQSVNGFGLAAQFYFNKPLQELNLDQHALLVGLAKGSSYYNPRKHPERALERRNVVLHNMLIMDKISQEDYEAAIAKPLGVVKDIKKVSVARPKFPDFLDYVRRELSTQYDAEVLQKAGLRVITTLDPIAQTAAEKALQGSLKQKEKLQGALVSADPNTGGVVALVGSKSDFTGFNRAIDTKRQVGSLLKPIIYLIALETGRYNLASGVLDAAQSYDGWTPKNYGGTSHGTVSMLTALNNSYNQAAVNTGMDIGLKHFIGYLHNLGINDSLPNYPSSLLGAVELSPVQMLGVYQIFANGGAAMPLHGTDKVIDEEGNIVTQKSPKKEYRIPADSAFLINFALQQVVKDGTAKAALNLNKTLNKPLDLAGKTGTTNDEKDAWFAGYSGNYVAVVWVGRDDNKPIGLTGGAGALPIWMSYMQRLPLEPVKLAKPDNVEWGFVESITGRHSEESCPDAIYIPYKKDTVSDEPSNCMAEFAEDARQAELLEEYGDEAVSFDEADDSQSDEPLGQEQETKIPDDNTTQEIDNSDSIDNTDTSNDVINGDDGDRLPGE